MVLLYEVDYSKLPLISTWPSTKISFQTNLRQEVSNRVAGSSDGDAISTCMKRGESHK